MFSSARLCAAIATAPALCVPAAAQQRDDVNAAALASFKEANTAYSRQDYARAVAFYELVVSADPDNAWGFAGQAYFFLGNSYDNLWNPARREDPGNEQLIERALRITSAQPRRCRRGCYGC